MSRCNTCPSNPSPEIAEEQVKSADATIHHQCMLRDAVFRAPFLLRCPTDMNEKSGESCSGTVCKLLT